MQLTRATVGKWRRRFIEHRISGLHDELRPGKPRSIDDERVAELINKTLHTKPTNGSTHWSVRAMAAETSISPTSVHRYFKLLGLQPHRSESFKLSTDPFFIEKLRDVVGLYLSPPESALVLCVDERSQCQALERTQPMGLGYVEGVARLCPSRHHDVVCSTQRPQWRGVGDMQTAPPASGVSVLSAGDRQGSPRGTGRALHIVDNYGSHKHPKVKAWLAARPRWHMHFILTYSSWLNQVERFFALITDKAIRRGSFGSVRQLVQRIDQFVAHYNQNCKPFMWTVTADSILAKLHRLCPRISGTGR